MSTEATAGDWIPHDGSECPVPPETLVEYHIRYDDSATLRFTASGLRWSYPSESDKWDDIVAYRISASVVARPAPSGGAEPRLADLQALARANMDEHEPAPSGGAPISDAALDEIEATALAQFTEYFVRNYPGPNTIIGDPLWHAPKIFRAATRSLVARVREAEAKVVATEDRAAETQMLAFQWSRRHDLLKAGKADGVPFPKPADVPDSIARAEAAESRLSALEAERDAATERAAKLEAALQNMMGAYDTPISRRKYPPDEFMEECLESGRAALEAARALLSPEGTK